MKQISLPDLLYLAISLTHYINNFARADLYFQIIFSFFVSYNMECTNAQTGKH